MSEFKRILINRKILFCLALLAAVCVGFYINTQYKSVNGESTEYFGVMSAYTSMLKIMDGKPLSQQKQAVEERLEYASVMCDLLSFERIKNESPDEYAELWAEQDEQLKSDYSEIAAQYEQNKDELDEDALMCETEALEKLQGQIEYIESYPNYLESIQAKAKQLNTISIFDQDNSLSSQNIAKTAAAYEGLENTELTLGNDELLTSVMNFDLAHYLVFVFTIIVVMSFVNERKRGLWSMVYASPGGRLHLALKRSGILAAAVFAANFIIYAALFVTAYFVCGGIENLFRSVQSIETFQNFVFPLNELEFIVFYLIANAATQLALGFVVWLILSAVQNVNMAIGTAGVIFGCEFLLYALLPSQSGFAVLKYVNLFLFINPTTAIVKYANINAFVTVLNLFWLTLISAVAVILVFAVLSVAVCARKRPCKTPSKLEILFIKFFGKLSGVYWEVIEKLGVVGTDLYKLLVIQKGIVALVIFVVLLFSSTTTGEIIYSDCDGIVNDFYEQYGGEVTEEAYAYIDGLEAEIAEVDAQLTLAAQDYKNGKITSDEYTNAQLKSDAYDSKREAFTKIRSILVYAEEMNSSSESAWLVNPNGYEKLLGESGYTRQQNFALLSVFCIIIVLSGVFAFERRSAVKNVLTASGGGREYLFKRKIIAVLIVTFAVWFIASAAEVYDVSAQYSLTDFDAPLKSFEFLSSLPFNISIGLFIALLYFTRLVLLTAVSLIVCLVSACARYEVCVALSSVALMLPSLLHRVGIEIFAVFSATVPIASAQLIETSDGLTFLIPIFILMILGVFCAVISHRIWCGKGRLGYAA